MGTSATPNGATSYPVERAAQTGQSIDKPDFTRPEVFLYEKPRRRGRDLMVGTDAVHAGGVFYLPQWPSEDNETYQSRATLTEVYGAFPRCVRAARGLVGAKPPTLNAGAPAAIVEHWKDIDGEGTHGEVFAMQCFERGLVEGPAFILVDYASVDDGADGTTTSATTKRAGKRAKKVANLEEHQKLGLRPHWIRIGCDQIRNWRTAKIGGKKVLTLVTIKEEVDEEVGEFAMVCVEQYRTIRLMPTGTITWTIWRKRTQGDQEVWYIEDEGVYRGPKRIPLAVGYLGRKDAMMVAEPSLSNLADLCIGLYRVTADRRWLMGIVHAPTFTLEGWVDPIAQPNPNGPVINSGQDIKLGPSAVLKLPLNCKASWTQADPNGLDSSKEEKGDISAQIASISIAFLSQERQGKETATAYRLNFASQTATLSDAARGLEDLLDDALEIHAQYMGITEAPPTASVNTTYSEDQLDAQTITALDGLATDGNLTRGTLLRILQKGNIIPDDIDIDVEEADLDQAERERNDQAARTAARASVMLAAGGGDTRTDDPASDPTAPTKKRAAKTATKRSKKATV